jgi:hypothetical protein
MGGGPCGAWPFYNHVDVTASQETYKLKGNGKPTTAAPFPYMSPSFTLWSDCAAETATLIELDYDSFYNNFQSSPALDFPSSNKLLTGSAAGTFPGRAFACVLERGTYECEDGNEYEYETYNCDYETSQPVDVDVTVTWTGTGTSTFPDRSSSVNRYTGGFSRYSYKGTSREATATFSVKVDGSPVNLGGFTDQYSYAYLSKSTSSSMETYKY